MIKEIILGEYKRTSDRFRSSEPFAIYFVYGPEGNFVVKGMDNEVWKFINEKFSKFICQYTFWHKGESRGGWKASANLQFFMYKKDKRFYVSMQTEKGWRANIMSFRRVPHRWLPEYDKSLTKEEQNKQAKDNLLRKYS